MTSLFGIAIFFDVTVFLLPFSKSFTKSLAYSSRESYCEFVYDKLYMWGRDSTKNLKIEKIKQSEKEQQHLGVTQIL